jgi:hypothetical protein
MVYGDRDIYYPEKARALFKRSKVFRILGRNSEAECDGKESLRLYRRSKPGDARPLGMLTDSDFDKIIVFWSR